MSVVDFQAIDTESKPLNYGSAFNTYYTYSFINNSLFYPLVPAPYIDFYQRFVRQWFYWYDGYVPYLHIQESGIFSTRLATTIVKKLASQINGGQLLLERDGFVYEHHDQEDGLAFAESWAKENDLSNKTDSFAEFVLAGGTSAMKLNSDGKDLWVQPMRLDTFFVDTDWKGEVCDFVGFVQSFNQMVKKNEKNYIYYLVEKRYFEIEDDEKVPYVKYIVKKATQNITTARDYNMSETQDMKWEDLPKKIKQSIKDQFNVTVGEPQRLPFDKELGIYLGKGTPHISNIPQLPFGESVFANIISYLMSYDYYFSSFNTNLYTSRSRVMMPKALQNPNNKREMNYNDGFDSFLYEKVPYTNPDDQKPIPLQFDLRAQDWTSIRNLLLESVSTAVGINASTLAGYLNDNTARTAREISTEEGATALFVENKRELLKTPLNKMLSTVMKFYGYADRIVVKFSKAGTTNLRNLVEIGQMLSGLGVDKRTIVEMIFNDKSQIQVNTILDRMDKEEIKKVKKDLIVEEAKTQTQEPEMNDTGLVQPNGNTMKGEPSKTSNIPPKEE